MNKLRKNNITQAIDLCMRYEMYDHTEEQQQHQNH